MKIVRRLLTAYWIVVILAVVLGIIGDVEFFYREMGPDYPKDLHYARFFTVSGRAFSSAQYLAFGIACECLLYIGGSIAELVSLRKQPTDRLY